MKNLIVGSLIALMGFSASAQTTPEINFDFWVGTWDLSWQGANGVEEKGRNVITKVLDGKVIQEQFEALEGAQKGYKGMSISVYNPSTKTWHQTWMDNQGGNINFTGETDGERRIFKTAPQQRNGQQVVSRMVFYDITDNAFSWDWESTTDGGKNWNLNWRIRYTRAQ
jgi:hypothetical protein